MASTFDTSSDDAQGTRVVPVSPDAFDFEAYAQYEADLLQRNRAFWQAESGVAVYRRFRVPTCFTWMCKDREASLAHQLGALQASMAYKGDIANFLEPWYGIGTLASAFGIDYVWPEKQAPVVPHAFQSIQEALERQPKSISETPIGRHTLGMIEYFLEATRGKLPVSLTDTQSPLNALSMLIDCNNFYMAFLEEPDGLKEMLGRLVPLQIDFINEQLKLLGDTVVWPGHGFASSRVFHGVGMSDDVMTLLSPSQYAEFGVPGLVACGKPFGGPVVHSCGNWGGKAETVRAIDGLVMVDGAFTAQTDPDPNDLPCFSEVFDQTGIVVDARMVGDRQTVLDTVRALWRPGMKLIAVTYCETPEEQAAVYDGIHELCGT